MNSLLLIKYNIKSLCKKKLIISLFLICQVIAYSLLLFIVSCGMKVNMDEPNLTFELTPTGDISVGEISEMINSIKDDKYLYNIVLELGEDIVATTTKNYRFVTFGQSLNRNSDDQAVIYYAEDIHINDKIELLGREYTVIGISLMSDKIEINYSEKIYQDNISAIKVIASNSSSVKRVKRMLNESGFNQYFTITEPAKIDIFNSLENSFILYILGGVLCLTLISYILCLSFFFRQQSKIFNIYRITGGSREFIFCMLNLTMLITIICICLLGSIVFYLLDLIVLNNTYTVIFISDYSLLFKDYICVAVLYLLAGFIFSPLLYQKIFFKIRRTAI